MEALEDKLAPGPDERHDLDAEDACLPLLQSLQQRFGDVCLVPSLTRGHDGLVLHDSELIGRVLLGNRGNYVKGAGIERVRMLLGNGLIASDGELWARQRKMMQPAFHGQVIRGFGALMDAANGRLVDRWSALAARGETIDLTRELSEVTLEIVLRALFGADLDSLVEREGRNPFDLLTEESRRDLPFAAKFRSLAKHVLAMIDSRRREGRVEHDFLSLLMEARDANDGAAMPDRVVLDEVMTLIVAGHETTASTLNWTWYLLSQHADAEERLHAALAAGGDDDPYPEHLLQEALRLYPPVWLFSRRAIGSDRLAGYHVAAGTDIFISPYLLHRHPAHWSRPDAFDPSRFAPQAAAGRHRFAYLPFSAGPRLCIGATFAMAEMKSHLGLVGARFRLEYAGSKPPEPEFQINLRSREPVRMRLVERRG